MQQEQFVNFAESSQLEPTQPMMQRCIAKRLGATLPDVSLS
jgi:hypothetical protein